MLEFAQVVANPFRLFRLGWEQLQRVLPLLMRALQIAVALVGSRTGGDAVEFVGVDQIVAVAARQRSRRDLT